MGYLSYLEAMETTFKFTYQLLKLLKGLIKGYLNYDIGYLGLLRGHLGVTYISTSVMEATYGLVRG
jgi:hypothetical protein